ncbi:MAG TPA: pyruvate, phosphate dikinase, partial [Gaiellaceae bacterium]|nr:pyruvate, phosphate dikinase [Gaiellaceae bacterium]
MSRYVYSFDEGAELGRALLGGKGSGLAEMTALGIPVPAGFTVTTEACVEYMRSGRRLPDGLEVEVDEHVRRLEESTGKRFGDRADPLLVSVRSGAAVSMPGMMDTILNLGLNDVAVEGLARTTGNARFAYDAYRRLIQMYGDVVDGVDAHRFESALSALKERRGARQDVDLSAEDLRELVERFKEIYAEGTGREFPQDARHQLGRAIEAVFDSWDTPRAQVYRRANDIPDDLGTAVNVVQMVFGNKGDTSGTGVCFTRDPSTGEPGLWGEFLTNAQGEDVVAGIRTPQPLADMREALPGAFAELEETIQRLEEHYREMQDIEFTVEEGSLYILQTRSGKRTAPAALRIAVDMVDEGLIDREQAVARIEAGQLDQLLHPMIDPDAEYEVVAKGLNASPGAATGKIAFDADSAEERGKAGQAVILVRWETTPDDIHGLMEAKGVLTAQGGMTSHAAVVARGMGKPCVAGCEALTIDVEARRARLGEHELGEEDIVTINGGTGEVIVGAVALVPPRIDENFETVLGWADDLRRLRVRANADTPEDAAKAREFGAEGIGLCRTEHMFMAEDRLPIVRQMIMASREEERRAVLERLLPFQQSDFEGIFEAMAGLPVTIRLLDPPLHEFLPSLEEADSEEMRRRIRALREENPMLGTRGCRLGLLYPEIYAMQVQAIIRAALAVEERTGDAPLVEIMH